MPIDIQVYEKIRKLSNEGHSNRKIAEMLGCSRNTVKKYCKGSSFPERKPEIQRRVAPLRDTVYPQLLHYLQMNQELPRKQKMSGHEIWLRLLKDGYAMSESTVRLWISQEKNQGKQAFVPLEFEPGEVMQVDWGTAHAYIGGERTLIHCFCAVLPFSFGLFMAVFPDETTESFLHGHLLAFRFFCGIPKVCLYDNLKTAVLSGSGKHAVPQDRFSKFAAHYAFTAKFCNVASGWEKGAVENGVSIARKIALSPMPHVDTWEELQQLVTQRCLSYCENHKLKRRSVPIKEALETERNNLNPMPLAELDPSIVVQALVHTDSTCSFQTNRYSAPVSLAGKTVTLRITPFKVYILSDGKEAACHTRSYAKHQTFYIPEHYLPLLEQKPGAIDHASPLRNGQWPEEIQEFRAKYKHPDLNTCLVAILQLFQKHSRDLVLKGVRWAAQQKQSSFELVQYFVDINENPSITLDQIEINTIPLDSYDTLLERK